MTMATTRRRKGAGRRRGTRRTRGSRHAASWSEPQVCFTFLFVSTLLTGHFLFYYYLFNESPLSLFSSEELLESNWAVWYACGINQNCWSEIRRDDSWAWCLAYQDHRLCRLSRGTRLTTSNLPFLCRLLTHWMTARFHIDERAAHWEGEVRHLPKIFIDLVSLSRS